MNTRSIITVVIVGLFFVISISSMTMCSWWLSLPKLHNTYSFDSHNNYAIPEGLMRIAHNGTSGATFKEIHIGT